MILKFFFGTSFLSYPLLKGLNYCQTRSSEISYNINYYFESFVIRIPVLFCTHKSSNG